MASKSYKAGFEKRYGDRYTNVSHSTTDKEIKEVYDEWASTYEKVITNITFLIKSQ